MRACTIFCWLILGGACAPSAQVDARVHRPAEPLEIAAAEPDELRCTFRLGPAPTVELGNIRGKVTVRVSSGQTVRLRAVKLNGSPVERARHRIEVEERGSWLRVRTRCQPPRRRCGQVAVLYELQVPAQTRLRCRTVSGPVDVVGVLGSEVSLKTVSGAITYASEDAGPTRLELGTVSGKIIARVGGGSGRARARTVSGAIRLELPQGGRNVKASTVSGPVRVLLARHLGARVKLSTLSGDLRSIGLPLSIEQRGRRTLRGTVGDGAVPIRASTVSGDVTLGLLQ